MFISGVVCVYVEEGLAAKPATTGSRYVKGM